MYRKVALGEAFEPIYDVRVNAALLSSGTGWRWSIALQKALSEIGDSSFWKITQKPLGVYSPSLEPSFQIFSYSVTNAKLNTVLGDQTVIDGKVSVDEGTASLQGGYEHTHPGDEIPVAEFFPHSVQLLVTPTSSDLETRYQLCLGSMQGFAAVHDHKLDFEALLAKQDAEKSDQYIDTMLRQGLEKRKMQLGKEIEEKGARLDRAMATWRTLKQDIPLLEHQLEGLENWEVDSELVADLRAQFDAIPEVIRYTIVANRGEKSTLQVFTTAFATQCIDKEDEPDRLIGPYILNFDLKTSKVKCINLNPAIEKNETSSITVHGPHLNDTGGGCHDTTIENERRRMLIEGQAPMAVILTLQLLKQWRAYDPMGKQAKLFPVAPTKKEKV